MSENILEKQLFEIIKNKEMAEHIKLAKIDMLVRLGVDVNAMYGAKSLLKLANEVKEEKIAKCLEEKGAKEFFDEEKAEELGQELLKECGQKEINFEKVKELINKGANIEAKNHDGIKSLILASSNGCSEVVKLLLEKGADVEAKKNNGYTSLICASEWGYSDVVKVLLEKGADIEARDNNGKTALDLARNYKIREMLEDARNKNSFLYKIKKGFGIGE